MTCEYLLDDVMLRGISQFLSGSTINEIRVLWGFGRNKTIKILKAQLGRMIYFKILMRQ